MHLKTENICLKTYVKLRIILFKNWKHVCLSECTKRGQSLSELVLLNHTFLQMGMLSDFSIQPSD